MDTWQQIATVGAGSVGMLASAVGIATATIASRMALRHREIRSAAVQELAVAQLRALQDLRQTMAERNVDAAKLSRIDGVLSAGSELARAESTKEIVARADRLRDLVQHLQTTAGPPPSQPRP